MSLSLTLSTALTGLQTQQAALQVVSNNVTNASTPGFTRKTAETMGRVLDGIGVGVELGSIKRTVDEALIREIRQSLAAMGAGNAAAPFYNQMQDLFGNPGDNSSISATLTDLANALESLAASPEGTTERSEVISAALALVQQLDNMSSKLQKLRTDAERQIASTVDSINSELQTIADLNDQIKKLAARGESTAALQDQRDVALDKLSSYISIRTFERSNGEVVIFTDQGTLLDTFPNFLSHSSSLIMAAGVSYPADIDGISLNNRDITTTVTGGELAGLISMRDTALPGLQAQIDELAAALRDELNALHNKGVGFPPASELTGSRLFDSANDEIAVSGTLRFAVVKADGTTPDNLAAAVPFEVDLGALAAPVTIQDVVDAINAQAAASPPQVIQAQLVSNGGQLQLQISTLSPSLRLVLDEGDSAVTAFTAAGGTAQTVQLHNGSAPGFSHFFGLNDFFTSTGFNAGDSDYTGLTRALNVRQDLADNPALLSRASAAMTFPLTGGQAVVTAGDNSIVQAMAAKFDERLSFGAAGGLPGTQTTLAGYGAEIVYANATAAARSESNVAIQQSLYGELKFRSDSLSGVNVDEELANMIVIQQAYSASARLISTVQELFQVLQAMV
ncbi:MAG: flagellar hook-associated protein FlgK [Kiloniellales bacterium]